MTVDSLASRDVVLELDNLSLFLDLDGTLAPIAPLPEGVGPDPVRNRVLTRLSNRLEGRLAVVSGRSIADVDRILEGAVACVAGSHGLQRRNARGDVSAVPPHPALMTAVADIQALSVENPNLRVELKPLSVALHYRGDPRAEADVQAAALDIARRTGLKLQLGQMVVELCTLGADKGHAVDAFLSETPFHGAIPVFVGDDLTDEDGFRAADAAAGYGVLVGRPRSSRARFRLDDTDAVLAWLDRGLETGHLILEYPL
ncbi:trehalose-phosphatase [Asticcacaulis sp. 201]|uniref:trehalose-phosphatase n=1 Tax=Asticcacaulis sp. 201 TaxID=3028787 RepID=UPI002915D8D3|nr:trehalose-phosphatase [Asticcacaulis sp. 201]MDV6331250.1 trehalose-phosphatase [Asticcacaulis sp. 201]